MIPPIFAGLCDDAAIFPPGSSPLSAAVPAHIRHRKAPYAELVGPLVATADAFGELSSLLDPAERLDLAVTLPSGPTGLPDVLTVEHRLPVRLHAVEIALPAGYPPDEMFAELNRRTRGTGPRPRVFVEVPRDERGLDVIARCAENGYAAKFRTGGVRADLYPDDAELAATVTAAVAADIPFKATAGLHHAIRTTDPSTGCEQHGFLNLLLAAAASVAGADVADVAAVLAERDADTIAADIENLVRDRTRQVRDHFLSFGTCSIADPLTELIALGLVPAAANDRLESTT